MQTILFRILLEEKFETFHFPLNTSISIFIAILEQEISFSFPKLGNICLRSLSLLTLLPFATSMLT